ncbi:MAG: Outer membrane protein [Parcubacteria bacterium 32_520]|nr:MAG: Outer membrane protein [Parcubacteria bacterium 32_520]
MKKKFFLICCVLLFLLSGFRGNQITAQEPISMGITQMIELAISNNLDYKITNYQLENTELEVQKLESENLLAASTISNLEKEITLIKQQNQFQSAKDQLLLQVVDDYFQLWATEKDMESKKKNVELEKIILENAEKQVAAGYSVDLDLLQQGNEYYDALFSYQESLLTHKKLIMEVKNRLGINNKQDIKLKVLSIPEFPEIDLKEAQSQARKNSLTLKSESLEIELAERELEKAKVNDLSQIEILKLENNLSIVQLERLLSQQDIDYQVEAQLLNYQQSKNDIVSSQKNIAEMEINASILEKQFQAGLRTEDELISATIGVLDAQSRLISSVREVYQAYLELQRLMGTLEEGVLP